MKSFRRIKKGLAVMLCVSMVQGMTPLTLNAEGFVDEFIDGTADGYDTGTGNTLYICAQSGGTGRLNIEAAYGSAIGGTQYGTNINQPGAGTIYINKIGTIYGGMLTQDMTVPKGYTLSVSGTDALTIGQNVTLTLNGTLQSGVSLINNGTVINNTNLTITGNITVEEGATGKIKAKKKGICHI